MAPTETTDADTRSTAQVMTQWRKLMEVKRQLIKQGLLNGDATPQQIVDTIRRQVPVDLML